MIEIRTQPVRSCRVSVPGSKSYSHRMMIASGLADGDSIVRNCLESEDLRLTINLPSPADIIQEAARRRKKKVLWDDYGEIIGVQ